MMKNEEWFNDKGIFSQEAVNVSNGEAGEKDTVNTTGIAIVVDGTEVILELEQLKDVVSYLEDDF